MSELEQLRAESATPAKHPLGNAVPCDNCGEHFARALEIETQELAEAMQLAIDYAAGRETEWGDRAVQSFDILESALSRHRAKQEVES